MKIILMAGLAFLPVLAMAQNGKFTIEGNIAHMRQDGKVYLFYSDGGAFTQDSALVKNGVFRLSGTVKEPAYAQLKLEHHTGDHTNRNVDQIGFYLESTKIVLHASDSLKHATITGSAINDDNQKLEALIAPLLSRQDAANTAYYSASGQQRQDSAFTAEWERMLTKVNREIGQTQRRFIRQHPDRYLSLILLIRIAGRDIDVPKIKPLYEQLSDSIRQTPGARKFEQLMQIAVNTEIGATASDFSQKDPEGREVHLSDFRGKYVLLDFWASWCGPCRAENPNYIKVYNAFKADGFTILGVSLDGPGARKKWLDAIEKDRLPWTQVSDLKYWDNDGAKLYGIKAIPQNFLIDPAGIIIAKDLRGDILIKKLHSIFDR